MTATLVGLGVVLLGFVGALGQLRRRFQQHDDQPADPPFDPPVVGGHVRVPYSGSERTTRRAALMPRHDGTTRRITKGERRRRARRAINPRKQARRKKTGGEDTGMAGAGTR